MLNVRLINREKGRAGAFSIEGIFNLVKAELEGRVLFSEYYYDLAISRWKNVLRLAEKSAAINHITGDVYFLALGLKSGKHIVTVHDIGHYTTLKGRNKLAAIVYKYFWLYIPFRKADVITVVSEFTRQQVVNMFGFTDSKLKLIPNPVKPIFKYAPRQQQGKKFTILQIGKGAHKNLNNLIEAVKGLDVCIDVVGDIPEAMMAKLNSYGVSHNIYVNISDAELNERYVNCDILFFASFYEGFGMPIIEAQAVGRPVITSNFGAMIEVAKDTACLVDPADVAGIRKAIIALQTDKALYDALVKKGRDNAAGYAASMVADAYYDLYKSLSNI